MEHRYAISDIAGIHLLRVDGYWYELPLDNDDLHLVVTFHSLDYAEAFCATKRAAGFHCKTFIRRPIAQRK